MAAPPPAHGGRTPFRDTSLVRANAGSGTRTTWEKVTVRYQAARTAHYGGVRRAPHVADPPLANSGRDPAPPR